MSGKARVLFDVRRIFRNFNIVHRPKTLPIDRNHGQKSYFARKVPELDHILITEFIKKFVSPIFIDNTRNDNGYRRESLNKIIYLVLI